MELFARHRNDLCLVAAGGFAALAMVAVACAHNHFHAPFFAIGFAILSGAIFYFSRKKTKHK